MSIPILPILNVVAMLGTVGLAAYSKLVFKRPAIREFSERERLAELHATPTPAPTAGSLKFGPITVNIAPTPDRPQSGDGPGAKMEGKLHYVTLSFSMEVRDESQQEIVEAVKPVFLDRMNHVLGKKHYHELTSAQGRYVLQSQLIDVANELARSASPSVPREGLVSAIYFTQFIVQ